MVPLRYTPNFGHIPNDGLLYPEGYDAITLHAQLWALAKRQLALPGRV
ncbi:MAG TPA: hypothetical protein VN452_03570 [Longilinea sp.]|nr:hypothetical protein [Longilinea sp.]